MGTLIISLLEAVVVVDIIQDLMTLMMDRMYKRVHLHKVHNIATSTSGPSSNARDSQSKCKDNVVLLQYRTRTQMISAIQPVACSMITTTSNRLCKFKIKILSVMATLLSLLHNR